MHRLFLGCNLWNALILSAAVALGLASSPHHARVAVFAAVFACLVQSGVIALFVGAAKLAKEHVGRFNLKPDLIARVNEIYHVLFPMAGIGVVAAAAAAILGGAADLGRVPGWLHAVTATAAWLYLLAVIPMEYRLQSRMHAIIDDVGRLLPPAEAVASTAPHPGYHPDRVVLDRAGRAKALVYIGLTLPLPYLGGTFISGHDLSYLLLPTIVLTAACLGAAAHQGLSARRGGRQGGGSSPSA